MKRDAAPLYWRVRVLMAEREIDSVRELRRRLAAVGYEISEAQLGRVRKSLPRLLDTELLAALCDALNVGPGDLLVRKSAPARTPPLPPPAVDETALPEKPARIPARLEAMEFPSSGPELGPLRRLEP